MKRIVAFHNAFLKTVRALGRMSEFGLVRRYKLSSLDLFGDIALAPAMMLRGKLHLVSRKIDGQKDVARIFDACRKEGQE